MASGPTPLQRIEQLRRLRVRGVPDLSVRADADGALRELKKMKRASGALGEQWGSLVPSAIAGVTSPGRFSRGVLTIHATDASAKYECERWLSAGGDASLRVAVQGLRTIKVVV